jgi:mannose-6-phosphate isomerase-like protein (cupin superfamily)
VVKSLYYGFAIVNPLAAPILFHIHLEKGVNMPHPESSPENQTSVDAANTFVHWQVTVEQALAKTRPVENLATPVLSHGSLEVEFYTPEGTDEQTPHTRDELYVVIQGHGWFVNEGQRVRFGPGDVLFVPAHAAHRFEEFSDDFQVWVMFYGPEGGEQNHQPS